MNISATSNSSLYNTGNFEAKNRQNPHSQTSGLSFQNSSSSSKVTISKEAQELASSSPDMNKYALPPWFEDFQPKVYTLNSEDSYQQGHIAKEKEYINEFRSELKEYNKIFSENYQETKAEHGIVTQEDAYEKMIKDAHFSEGVRRSLEEKMRNNPRAAELMNTLGIAKA